MDSIASILIVDDDPVNIQVLKGAVGRQYEVYCASSGEQALELVRLHHPDLILLDICMPDMDGYEVCRILKADADTCDIPVIFVTALTSSEEELYGLELGATDFICKPVNAPLVRQRVINCLTLKLQRDELARQLLKVEELNHSLMQERETTKVLRGLIPICCVCKNIRNDEGYWKKVEEYITENSEAAFSHGYCPDCSRAVIETFKKSREQQNDPSAAKHPGDAHDVSG